MLKGVVSWWRDFVTNDRDRWSPLLDTMDAEAVYALLFDLIYGEAGTIGVISTDPQVIADAFSRFKISHLGMSAFDRYTIFLVEPPGEAHTTDLAARRRADTRSVAPAAGDARGRSKVPAGDRRDRPRITRRAVVPAIRSPAPASSHPTRVTRRG